jgi:hypothetical protein
VREEAARQVLLIQALEEADAEGRLVSLADRRRATEVTRGGGATDPAVLVAGRAAHLVEQLAGRLPWIDAALAATRFPRGVAWALPVLAAGAGLLTDALGPERRVNILSVPLLGLCLWNIGVYAVLVAHVLARTSSRRRGPAAGTGRGPEAGRGGGARLVTGWAAGWGRRRLRTAATGPVRPALAQYLTRWHRLAAPLSAARMAGLFHAGAALLAVGVLVGAYGRGLAFEYQATWESTFLDAHGLRAVLVGLLGPASLLLGAPIPPPEALAALRAPAAGDAAPWIHRYALTTLLVVVVPRALLAASAHARARRLAADLPVDLRAPYVLRLLAGSRALARVHVRPYATRLEGQSEAALRRLLRDLVGGAGEVVMEPAAAYGAEPPEVLPETPAAGSPPGDGLETWQALVFSLAQSPEDEVHGELLARLVAWTAAGRRGGRRGLAVVDAAPYRLRLAGTGAEARRLADRQRAWDAVAHRAGVTLAHVDLAGTAGGDDEALGRLLGGLWPAPAGA